MRASPIISEGQLFARPLEQNTYPNILEEPSEMKTSLVLVVVALACLEKSSAEHLKLGSSYNARLIHTNKVEYVAFPLLKRVKEYFYNDPAQQIIKGIIVRDLDETQSKATITAGGIGQSFVNLRFKSERSGGLNYNVEIYA